MNNPVIPEREPSLPVENREFFDSPLPLDSKFYIKRPPIEVRAYAEIAKPGSIVRIKAPKKMGKSSLMLRLIHHATTLGYRTVLIDFQQADAAIFESLNRFLRWLCINVARQLELVPNLDDYWDEEMGSKVSATIYFEGYLLPQINSPLVLVFNEVNRVFEYANISQEFLPLLRVWYEQARQVKVWQNLRLLLVYSTEVYISLGINQSPFNVGLAIELPEFTSAQVGDLAQRYGLNLSEDQIQQLTKMIGGHPYLVHLALYHLCHQHDTLEPLLQAAPTLTGIYTEHLLSHWLALQKKSELADAIQRLVTAKSSIQLDPLIAYQLNSMGLVKLDENACALSCELYRLYFKSQQLGKESENATIIKRLEQENQHLKALVYIDPLTQVPNRRQFDNYFQSEWKRMLREVAPLSLIVCDIDYFKVYNDNYGHQAGDDCLWQVAQAIRQVLQRPGDFLARYGGEEFVIILPRTDAAGAMHIAEKVRLSIKTAALPFEANKSSNFNSSVVTISLGVASIIPNFQRDARELFLAADQALYESKKQGRDRVNISPIFKLELC